MDVQIKLVSLFEAVMEHPSLYTLEGSYLEGIAFLEGCQTGFMKWHPNKEEMGHYFFEFIEEYQSFKEWLTLKFGLEEKDALRSLNVHGGQSFQVALELYKNFINQK